MFRQSMVYIDFFNISCMECPVYKIDPLPWCDSNRILRKESILGTSATKNMKFWKELKKGETKYGENSQGDEIGKGIFTEFFITE